MSSIKRRILFQRLRMNASYIIQSVLCVFLCRIAGRCVRETRPSEHVQCFGIAERARSINTAFVEGEKGSEEPFICLRVVTDWHSFGFSFFGFSFYDRLLLGLFLSLFPRYLPLQIRVNEKSVCCLRSMRYFIDVLTDFPSLACIVYIPRSIIAVWNTKLVFESSFRRIE